jgi:hypothetical protein
VPDRAKEIEGFSIVVLGSFNPAIFHPLWFVKHNLIREEEGTEAKIEIIHSEAASFKAGWFSLQVTHDRYALNSDDPTKSQPLRDLASGTFKVLEHTPLSAYGFHNWMHFRMESEAEWHRFGDYFAPKPAWKSLLTNPGLTSLVIQGKRDGSEADQVFINLQPSATIKPGIYVHVHQHYSGDQEKKSPTDGTVTFQKALRDEWNNFVTYSQNVPAQVFASFDKTG